MCNVQDIEALQRQVEELQAANDKLDKSKKKLQAELEDSNIDLEAQRAKVLELEKKQRNFDKVLAEEKVCLLFNSYFQSILHINLLFPLKMWLRQ